MIVTLTWLLPGKRGLRKRIDQRRDSHPQLSLYQEDTEDLSKYIERRAAWAAVAVDTLHPRN